jgi:hypothetical protein
MSHPAVTAPIIGARNLSQLADSLAALDVAMTAGLRAEISALSVTPAPATDRTETLKDLQKLYPHRVSSGDRGSTAAISAVVDPRSHRAPDSRRCFVPERGKCPPRPCPGPAPVRF